MDRFFEWPVWADITGVAAGVGLFACALFITRYHVETGGAWWRNRDGTANDFGRMLFFRKCIVAFLFSGALVHWYAPEWHGIHFIRAVVFSSFAAETFVLYGLLMKAQRAAREVRK